MGPQLLGPKVVLKEALSNEDFWVQSWGIVGGQGSQRREHWVQAVFVLVLF